jgi:hypothetical protein
MSDLIQKVKNKLAALGIDYDSVSLSNRPGKKIKIIINGKTIHFGDKNSTTFIEKEDEKKRMAYQARASKIKNKNGEYTYKIKYTPNYLAFHVLW